MDMDIDPEIIEYFKNDGNMTDPNDLLKMHNIAKETQIQPRILSGEWEVYALEKKLSDPLSYCAHIGTFRTLMKKKASKLKKAASEPPKKGQKQASTTNKSNEPSNNSSLVAKSKSTATTNSSKSNGSSTNTVSNKTTTTPSNDDFDFDFGDNDNTNGDGVTDNKDISNNNDDDNIDFDLKGFPSLLPISKKKAITFNYNNRKGSNTIVQSFNNLKHKSTDECDPVVSVRSLNGRAAVDFKTMHYMSDSLMSRNKLLMKNTMSTLEGGDDVGEPMVFSDSVSGETVKEDVFVVINDKLVEIGKVESESDKENNTKILRLTGRVCVTNNNILSSSFSLMGQKDSSVNTFSMVPIADGNNKPKENIIPLFPGQMIMVEGPNIPGHNFGCSKVYYPKPLELYKGSKQCEKPVHIMFASGPFSTYQNIDYSALDDFLKIVEKKNCQLVILFGPFVDEKHHKIYYTEEEDIFEKYVLSKLAKLSSTKFYLVPSLRDINSEYVFPQPPLQTSRKYENIQFVSNPHNLIINDSFTIGLNNTNVIQDIESAITKKCKVNTTDICKMIIEQQTYYPLHPSEVPIEMEYVDSLKFPGVTPNIVLFGSETHFTENVNQVLCVSSGSLIFEGSQGCYTDIYVSNKDDKLCENTKVTTTKI